MLPVATKKSWFGFRPLFRKGIARMRHRPTGASESRCLYLVTGADLTAGGDLPIFPATSAADSAANRLAESVKIHGLS
jgi:hypothetical protein